MEGNSAMMSSAVEMWGLLVVWVLGVDMIWSIVLGDVFQTLRHGDVRNGLWIAPRENASLCVVAHGMMAPATES